MATNNTRTNVSKSLFVVVNDTNTGKVKRIAVPSDLQVGLQDNPAELQLLGRLSVSTNDLHVGSSITNLSSNNTIANVYATAAMSGSNISLMLPSNPRDGELHIIKDASGTAAASPLIVTSADSSLIDGSASVTMSTAYGSLLVYWATSAWRQFATSTGGGGGASTNSTYALISSDPTLPNSRTLTAGTNVSFSDAGPGSTLTINATGGSGGGADSQATYVLEAATSSLPNSRTLTAGTRIVITDGGPGSTLTLASSLSGSNFNGWIDGGNKMRTTGSIAIASDGGFAPNYGTDNFLYVSGTVGLAQGTSGRLVSTFGGDTLFSGSVIASGSGVVFPSLITVPTPPTALGVANVYAANHAGIMRPQLTMQWVNGWPSASLHPHVAFTRQCFWRAANGGITNGAMFGRAVFRGNASQPTSLNATGSYGQRWAIIEGTTSNQSNIGMDLGTDNPVWMGQDTQTGGFYFCTIFSIDQAQISTAQATVTSSFFAGLCDNLGAGSPFVQTKDWETDTAGGKIGFGWTARFAGNNIINKNPGVTGSYNWKAMAGPNARRAQQTDTGIPIVCQHYLCAQLYEPAGASGSVYWALQDLTTGQAASGQFLASNNALPSPFDGPGGQNYLYPGMNGLYLTGSGTSFNLRLVTMYIDTPY